MMLLLRKFAILAVGLPLAVVRQVDAYSYDSLISKLQSNLRLDKKYQYYSKSSNTFYFRSEEKCALLNCYKYKIAIHFSQDTTWISTLSSFRIVPFTDKLEKTESGKRSVKSLYSQIRIALDTIAKGAIVFYDNDKEDDPLDYTTHSIRKNTAFGGRIEEVITPTVALHIKYQSFWHLFKNGLGDHPNLDTIPTGGIFVIDDFYCGLNDEPRNLHTFLTIPDFKRISEVDTSAFGKPKISKQRHSQDRGRCSETYKYYLAVNTFHPDTFRLVAIGSIPSNSESQISDSRIYLRQDDSTIKATNFKKLP